ncbi:YitT family protein [Lactobacillus terrae]|uniref:YitT family protein n=1 Tax=Lactobacillus terrae TaxID=2269374 RepID=UPI000C1B6BED|nr:YitT family protein [Lactobacillus terrae]
MTNNKKNFILKAVLVVIALEIIVISINMFFEPSRIAAGGATGIAILLFEAFSFPTALTVFLINIVMLIFSYIFLDKETTIKLSFGSFVLPVLIFITPVYNVIPNRILSIIIGSIIFGIGLAILYMLDMSSGGTTVPPMIFHKTLGIEKYIGLFIIDALVCIGNIFVSGFSAFILALASVAISSLTIKIYTVIENKFAND